MILCFDPKDQVEILFPMVDYVDIHIKINFQGQYFARFADLSTLKLKVKTMFVPHSCLCCST